MDQQQAAVADEDTPDGWLWKCFADGFIKLHLLHLEGAPDAYHFVECLETWAGTLFERENMRWDQEWNEALDAPRIFDAFQELCRISERWPAPKNFLDCLARIPRSKQPAAETRKRP